MMERLVRRAWYLIRRRRFDADLAEELAIHQAMKQRELERAGLEPTEAAFAAQRALGSTALARDRARDVWLPYWLQGCGQDLRLAVRTLRATPLVTTVAVLSLALGIGANTAIFSVIDSLILRALPGVAEPDHLVTMSSGQTNDTGISTSGEPRWSYAFWKEIEQRSDAFDGALAWSAARFDLSAGGESEPVAGVFTSGDFFTALGVPALMGRTFTAADDARGSGAPVAVISYDFWQRRFGASPQVLGTPLTIDRTPFTIVGVTPPGFFGTDVGRTFDVAVPVATEPLIRGSQSFLTAPFDRFNYWLVVALRLSHRQSLEAATAVLRGMQPQIRDGAEPHIPGTPTVEFLKEPFTLHPQSARGPRNCAGCIGDRYWPSSLSLPWCCSSRAPTLRISS